MLNLGRASRSRPRTRRERARRIGDELPDGVETLVDLTCELVEPAGVRARPGYLCVATLDGAAPPLATLREAVERVAERERVLIHCAQGHGRTGLFAACLLLRRGLASTPEQALAQIVAARPGVRLSAAQRARLDEFARSGLSM